MQTTRFALAEAKEILSRTPRVLEALVPGLSRDWVEADEGPETWSPRVVLGHLIHGERTDWIARAKIILAGDESATFEPFDRFAQLRDFGATPVPELVSLFARLRAGNLATLDAFRLTDADLAKRARHPAFGPVTLRELLATWVVHDLGHLAQIEDVRKLDRAADWTAGPRPAPSTAQAVDGMGLPAAEERELLTGVEEAATICSHPQIARVMAKRYGGDVGPWEACLPVLHDRKPVRP